MNLQGIVDKFPSKLDFLEKLRQEVVRLADENPDFRYNTSGKKAGCKYNGPARSSDELAGPDCKGCLFGQALQNMGWDVEHELNYGGEIHSLLESISPEFADSISINSLQHVQTRQDNGTAWKEATRFIQEPFVRF